MKLKAKKRDLEGKKVASLRNEKQLPAVVYGPKRESLSIVVDSSDFGQLFREVGVNKLFELEVDNSKPVMVLVKEVQKDYLKDQFIHISFYEVDPESKISTEVPVRLTGVSMAVKNNIGFLVNPLDTLALRCLPRDIPEEIEIGIDSLNEVGDSITLANIDLPENVEFLPSADMTVAVAYIAPPQKEIVEEEVVEVAEGEEAEEEGESTAEEEDGEEAVGEETDQTKD